MKRRPLTNFLLTAALWLLQLGGLFLSDCIMYLGSEDTGRSDGSGFLPITILRPNPFFLVLGILLSFAVFALIWFRLMRGTWPPCLHLHPVWTALWIGEALLALVLMFPVFFLAEMTRIPLFSRPEPDIEGPYIIFYYTAVILTAAIDCTGMTLKRKKEETTY